MMFLVAVSTCYLDFHSIINVVISETIKSELITIYDDHVGWRVYLLGKYTWSGLNASILILFVYMTL